MIGIDDTLTRIRLDPRDEEAWQAFYAHFAKQVLGTLYMLGVRNAATRDDLCSDIFLRFVRYSPWRLDWTRLPGPGAVSQYLRTTTYNTWRTMAKREIRDRAAENAEIVPPPGLGGLTARHDIGSFLATLTPFDRLLFSNYFIEGITLTLVAEMNDVSYSAAASRLSRLRQKFLQFWRT